MSTHPSTPAVLSAGADVHAGLSKDQVETGRRQYGPNEVLEKKPRALFTFLTKFWGLSAWMLEAIAALSWALHQIGRFRLSFVLGEPKASWTRFAAACK